MHQCKQEMKWNGRTKYFWGSVGGGGGGEKKIIRDLIIIS